MELWQLGPRTPDEGNSSQFKPKSRATTRTQALLQPSTHLAPKPPRAAEWSSSRCAYWRKPGPMRNRPNTAATGKHGTIVVNQHDVRDFNSTDKGDSCMFKACRHGCFCFLVRPRSRGMRGAASPSGRWKPYDGPKRRGGGGSSSKRIIMQYIDIDKTRRQYNKAEPSRNQA